MTTRPSSELIAREFTDLVWDYTRRLRAASRHLTDLTLAQQAVLSHLERDGDLTSAELARHERVRPQSMNATVTSLRAADLVEDVPEEGRGHRREVRLTPAGRDHLLAVREQRTRWIADLLDERLDGAQRDAVAESLPLLRSLLAADADTRSGRDGDEPRRG